jgi:N6-adenosine-specific RNA methylase IME4
MKKKELLGWNVAMIDPPWPKKKGGIRSVRPNQGSTLDYCTMPVESIFAMLDAEVFSRSSTNNVVFLWGVDEFLFDGEGQMERRGYRRHARLIWDKINGVAPAFSVRFSHEYLTWFYKGKFIPVDKSMRGKARTVMTEAATVHSAKPEVAYRSVELWFPDARKIDVFSRRPRAGWQQFGDQPNHLPVR